MDLYELENPSIPYSEKQKQLNHASLNGNSDAASAQRVISNELLAEGTGQGRIETSPSGRGNPTRKSYAAAAAKPKYGRSIDASSLPTPGMQGEYPTICLIKEEVDRAQSLGETEVVNSSQGKWLREKPMTRNQKKKWRKKNRTANEEAPNSEIHPLMVEEHEPRQQEAERAEVNRSETDVVVEEADRQSQEVSESEGGNQTQAHEDLGTASEVETAVGINLEPNPEVLGRLFFSPVTRKGTLLPCFKAAETTTVAATPDELVIEVCDETGVAELKLKIGDFEMNLKHNIGATSTSIPVISTSEPTAVPSKPVAESAPTSSSPSLPKETISPFKYVSPEKSSKLASLEASGSNGYVLVLSPTVGSIRTGRTVKGKKQPPSDVAGEVLKLLFSDGEAIGYGDPLLAVLPSFHGIKD
ncbi:hypothetical protein IFM89_035256 [Coptis chinensis]|uniref:Uncharacterized protein n=1 Tax=Coptis chinensis TaxID=261450 RepID=A0A835H0P8_9MAGN|nr:hypothetical protein IFM89_035256 [Coptis chinensis]